MRRPARYHIERADQLEALTSPARLEILSAVEALGPCAVAEIAGSVGRAPSSLYFHLEKLTAAGLVEREEGEEGALYRTPGRSMSLAYEPDDPVRLELLLRATTALFRSAERTLRDAFSSGLARVRGARRDTVLVNQRARLAPDEIREVREHVEAIEAIYVAARKTGTGTPVGTLHSFSAGMAPVTPREQKRRPQRG